MKRTNYFIKGILLGLFLTFTLFLSANTASAATIYDESQTEVTEMTPYLVTTGNEADLSKSNTYIITTTTENEVIPITSSKKGYLTYAIGSLTSATITIYSDAAASTQAGNSTNISSSSSLVDGMYIESNYAYFSDAATYYVQFSVAGTYVFSSNLINGSNRTLANNTYTTAYSYSNSSFDYDSDTLYYKVTASKNGYITVSTEYIDSTYGSSNITLCNSKKKAISEEVYNSANSSYSTAVFSVKKGTTYYLKVNSTSGTYRIKSKLTGVSETSGTKKSKAVKLSIGKAKKGLVLAEEKTSKNDYYKFTLSKATKLDLTAEGNASSGTIYVELTSDDIGGSITLRLTGSNAAQSSSLTTYTSTKLPKGTYYIRVYKEDKTTTGNYSIKVSKAS